jgi:beta-galactosidase
MKRRCLFLIKAAAALCLAALTANAADQPSRQVLSLDGLWQIAEGAMDRPPAAFGRTVPVPGLVSLATPAFADPPGPKVADRGRVPQKDPKRDAFWYRRIFLFEQSTPAVAVIKVHKAMFGTRVVLNGQILGDHLPSFTPGYFNAASALRNGENELLIRVGADRDAVGRTIPSGFDFEKERYIPGIFDSVELILSGTPHFTQVQAAPEIAAKTVRVQSILRNEGEAAWPAVSFIVREAKSGRVVGRLSTTASLAKNAESIMDVRIPMEDCHLWSPEEPFLYTLDADCGTDHLQTRFGMREFKFDPATGRAMLNGRPYFMRGSNFTLYRFFEDSECKDLPWRKDWVRLLHQRLKEMHWNCLRYCIGFPPETWYDVADEVGILIQDEFPIWSLTKATKREELSTEYAEWMRERWNHPCVVIWDANNETRSSETGPAIRQVRSLDLSNRPWDNSYNPPQEPGDVFESHPYHFNPSFRLANLATADPVPQGNQTRNDGKHAVIINEYGWHWLNRDGTPSTLTRDIYRSVLGENATAAQRFHMQATWLAADTEFWRSHRQAAAVVHFTMLGYSRPDGQTCDHWRNVERLEWEPEFYRYVRDAFAPVGLAVNFWKDKVIPKTQARVPVILINDLDRPWNGPVTLKLRPAGGDTVCFDATKQAHLDPFGQATLDFDVTWPDVLGACALEVELLGADAQPVRSFRELEIIDAHSLGLAYLKPATASSVHSAAYAPANALDGDPATYWSSTFADPAWLAVDLEEVHKISHVRITWENAYSKVFAVQCSRDGQNWTDMHRAEDGHGGVSEIMFTPVETRHVRVLCIKRGTPWGHAIREFQVFE